MDQPKHKPPKSFKRELIVGTGSVLVIFGIFFTVLFIISRAETQKTLWVAISLFVTIVGWVIVRTQATSFLSTLELILKRLLSALLNPLNWR